MNWKHMDIKKKLAIGFGTVLILLIAVCILSFSGVSGIVGNAEVVIHGNQIDAILAQKEVDHLNWANKINALLTDDSVTTLEVETNDHKCGFGQWLYGEGRTEAEALVPSLGPLFKKIEAPHRHLHESAIEIQKTFKQADTELATMFALREIDHLKWASQIRDALLNETNQLTVQTDAHQCALGKWLDSAKARHIYANGDVDFRNAWDKMVTDHKDLHASAVKIQNALQSSPEAAPRVFKDNTMPILNRTLGLLEELREEAEHELHGMQEANRIYSTQTLSALGEVQKMLGDIRAEARKNIMTDEAMLHAALRTKSSVMIVGAVAVIAGLLLAFFLAKGIAAVLQRIAREMGEGAAQVASAASQVSSSSQSLAEGASEQAASIEETSSSLEEMSAMTQQNADNAGQARGLMSEANQVVEQANASMGQLTTSMGEISQASEETQKIVKTIDEIAFQTNLLALNAAVEAARAGEAGAGFAVVADEVRNLAMRAAEAAKNTAELIEETVKKVGDGSGLVSLTNEAFAKVSDSSRKVGDLINEIAAASGEQAQGIEQVNTAVSEMGQVTQQNAANAEESASASEELSAQAEQMQAMVNELMAMVDGRRKAGEPKKSRKLSDAAAPRRKAAKAPEQVIPFDDDKAFAEF